MKRLLTAGELHRQCDLAFLGCRTTAGLVPLRGVIGRRRAMEAIDFGLSIKKRGYNIFLVGSAGSGKTTIVRRLIGERARGEARPGDWCYVHNFDNQDEPVPIRLGAGQGEEFLRHMERLVALLEKETAELLDSKSFRERRARLKERYLKLLDRQADRLGREAKRRGVMLQGVEGQIVPTPLADGKPLEAGEFQALPEAGKERVSANLRAIGERIEEYTREKGRINERLMDELAAMERGLLRPRVEQLIRMVRDHHRDNRQIEEYLDGLVEHVMVRIEAFLPEDLRQNGSGGGENEPPPPERLPGDAHETFRVNLFINNRRQAGAPVIYETNPTYPNLFGTVDYKESMGVVFTSHTLIKPGSLHRANGGYLILQASDMFRFPDTWEALKRALRLGRVSIEEGREQYRIKQPVSPRPGPMPLDVKVVLIGSPEQYYVLSQFDDEFRRLFRVTADFDGDMRYTRANLEACARFVSSVCEEENFLPLTRDALERLMEHSCRLAGDRERLTTRFADIINIVTEANHWAEKAGRRSVSGREVQLAIRKRAEQSNRVEEEMLQEIRRGNILISTGGEVAGQINGLAVYTLGEYSFGVPSRITAKVWAGRRGIIAIDREVNLSGSIHDKGSMILAGFFGERFASDRPIAFSASIAFEQLYGMVDGDSASCAELYALLSSLSGAPIRQGIAVTGSVNQQGEVQPIGGVNEKIEGFFAICSSKGLSGSQGVIIPRQNEKNLMLARPVVEAVSAGRFHVWSISHVDEGIELLTGLPAGRRRKDGGWPAGTINRLVDERLLHLARAIRDAHDE